MAQANRIFGEATPLIEEKVDTGLTGLLAVYRTPHKPYGEKPNELQRRFSIQPDTRLELLDHPYAKAYKATDEVSPQRSIYAMVCETKMPYRDHAIQGMVGINNPAISPMLAAGTVYCSFLGESRQVLFIDRPSGTRLTEIMQTNPRMHEHRIIDYIIQPAFRALSALFEKKLSHGNIYPGNFFISETTVVGECYSAPCGTLAHYLYHPLERLLCSPLGFGEANEKTDLYALGILAYELMFGLDKIKTVPLRDYVRMIMNYGSYQMLISTRNLSEAFQDFFRGTLNDNPAERWGIDQLAQWVNGKRFNMVVPILPKEAARPLVFLNEEYVNRRLLAHAFHRYWREATKDIRALKVDRWCESSLHRPEVTERMERALRSAGDASTEKQTYDTMTRIIAILDPTGPIRTMSLSMRPDSMGLLLADMMLKQESPPEMMRMLDLIETDVPTYWSELQDINKIGDMPQILWRIQKAKPYLRKKTHGFGLERVLYEMNPSLPCQMDLLAKFHISTAQDALKALDAIAVEVGATHNFVDRHLAAFIACKIEMGKEIRIADMISSNQLTHHEELVVLRILAKAQQKYKLFPLIGLCTWAAMRVEIMLDDMHNRILRKDLKLQLKTLAATGKLSEVLATIFDRDVTERDAEGFAHAVALHQVNYKKIERFRNPRLMDYYARDLGGKMAMVIAYIILAVTSYIVIANATGL